VKKIYIVVNFFIWITIKNYLCDIKKWKNKIKIFWYWLTVKNIKKKCEKKSWQTSPCPWSRLWRSITARLETWIIQVELLAINALPCEMTALTHLETWFLTFSALEMRDSIICVTLAAFCFLCTIGWRCKINQNSWDRCCDQQ
jgi:hypothetical protein